MKVTTLVAVLVAAAAAGVGAVAIPALSKPGPAGEEGSRPIQAAVGNNEPAAIPNTAPAAGTTAPKAQPKPAAKPKPRTAIFPAPAAPTDHLRYAHETVAPGASDTGPYQISHVYEVQIRLQRVGVYSGPLTGFYKEQTTAAVRRFQKEQGLPQTGVVNQATWNALIELSTQRSEGWKALPAACREPGWHSCYSRPTHEMFTLYNGGLWNAWLVRGGMAGLETIVGTHAVAWRDIDHWSIAYDGPMPYSQFFYGGEAIHGSGTMVNPLAGHSHGCINMYIEDSAELWQLTAGQPHTVVVYGAWA